MKNKKTTIEIHKEIDEIIKSLSLDQLKPRFNILYEYIKTFDENDTSEIEGVIVNAYSDMVVIKICKFFEMSSRNLGESHKLKSKSTKKMSHNPRELWNKVKKQLVVEINCNLKFDSKLLEFCERRNGIVHEEMYKTFEYSINQLLNIILQYLKSLTFINEICKISNKTINSIKQDKDKLKTNIEAKIKAINTKNKKRKIN